jgi:hypothetical protein
VVRSGVREAWPRRSHGAVHVHTDASGDGHASIDDVARAARAAGLGFIVVTDHNNEASLAADAYRHGVLVVAGLEKSTDAGHTLVLGIGAMPFRLDGDPATVVADVQELGGFLVAAHPYSSLPESRWTGGFEGVAALEFLNLAVPDGWPRGLARVPALAHYAFDAQGALLAGLRVDPKPFALWDRIAQQRPLAGVLGSDAHGGLISHREVFRLASQHLLLDAPFAGEAHHDADLVRDALRRGRGYGALDALADPGGFLVEASSGEKRATLGEDLPLEGEALIRAEADAPAGATLVLLRDGAEMARGSRILHRTSQAGSYRVLGYLDGPGPSALPWIVSNPIYVYPAAELSARAARAQALPAEEPAATAITEPLDALDAGQLASQWIPEHSQDAQARLSLEGGALRLDYVLGPGPPSHAAACYWKQLDLSGHRNLVFRVRADRATRFDLQVRVADAAAPGGVRIWRRSVRAASPWRTAVVSLRDLKTYDKRGGVPELRNVQSLHFHLDEATMAPGSRGALFIEDVGLTSGP